jgi:hypothetical protein
VPVFPGCEQGAQLDVDGRFTISALVHGPATKLQPALAILHRFVQDANSFGGLMGGAKKHPDTLRAMELWKDSTYSIAEAAKINRISPSTLYRALFPNGKNGSKKRIALRKEGEYAWKSK